LQSVRIEKDYTTQKQFTIGLLSDIHLDAKHHDRQRFESDMDYLLDKQASVLINGDLVDAIMPTDRKRYSRAGDGLTEDAQLNELCQFAVDRLAKYADIIDYISYGNHEVTCVKYNNFDILQLIVYLLNQLRTKEKPPIQRGGYCGFVEYVFRRKDAATRRFTIYRDHGKGGNSPVTKGMIPLARLYASYAADLYWLGHSHQSLIDSASQWTIGVSGNGQVYHKPKIGIVTPGYHLCFESKNYKADTLYRNNFAEERFFAPTGIGYGLLELDLSQNIIKPKVSIV
jgi:hypothetical protein